MIDPAQIIRYLLVGGFVTLADIAIYNFLTGRRNWMPRVPANILSTTCGMALGFTLHFSLVFNPHDAQVPFRVVKYVVTVACSVYGVQTFVIYALAELWRAPVRVTQGIVGLVALPTRFSDDFIDRMTGKVAGVVAGMVWNFVLFKYFVYAG